jgi:peptidoglycan/LPS O-acetylase OafA/YrhL
VEIFFVLSGFCLSYPLLKEPARPDDWARYARHRLRRIFPPYWAAYLLFLGLSLLIQWQQIEPLLQEQLLPVPSLRQFFVTFLLVGVWFNPAFWTLTVEVRWYAALPFCVTIVRKIGVALLLLSVIGSAAFAMLESRLPGRLRFLAAELPLLCRPTGSRLWP